MAAKRQEEQEAPENHERWLITYADLITLLLVFFIVMYTMAKVDAGKYSAVAQSLAGAFNGSPSFNEGNGGVLPEGVLKSPSGSGDNGEGSEQAKMDSIETQINELAKQYNLQDYITITEEQRGLDVEIRNELTNMVLFDSGSSKLNPDAAEIITKIGLILNELPDNQLRVEGHTDNIPINSALFPSNWELSTSRATNVVKHLISTSGISPSRFSAEGYAEYKPVAGNDTESGRARNRRVNIVIIKSKYNSLDSKVSTVSFTSSARK